MEKSRWSEWTNKALLGFCKMKFTLIIITLETDLNYSCFVLFQDWRIQSSHNLFPHTPIVYLVFHFTNLTLFFQHSVNSYGPSPRIFTPPYGTVHLFLASPHSFFQSTLEYYFTFFIFLISLLLTVTPRVLLNSITSNTSTLSQEFSIYDSALFKKSLVEVQCSLPLKEVGMNEQTSSFV